jgi:hypothetical protein
MIGYEDQIELGLIEKPKSFLRKLIDFSLGGAWIWLGRIAILTTIATGIILLFQFLSNIQKQKSESIPKEKIINQLDSKTNSIDSTCISKTDSLPKSLSQH